VTLPANAVLSTARAWPAGTAVWRANSMSNDPARRISSLSNQGAVFSLSDFNELEQTSSANFPVWCAGVDFSGRISYSSTAMPRRAHCQAASQPARPAPIIFGFIASLLEIANRSFIARCEPFQRRAFQQHGLPLAQDFRAQ